MALNYHRIDTRFNTTTNGPNQVQGIITDIQVDPFVDLQNFEDQVQIDFDKPVPTEPDFFFSYDSIAAQIISSNQTDRDNYSDEINPNIDTQGRYWYAAANFISINSATFQRLSNTNAVGYFFPSGSDDSIIGGFRVPRNTNLDRDLRLRVWYSLSLAQGGGGDTIRVRLRTKYAQIDQDIKINSGGTFDTIESKNVTVSANSKERARFAFDFDRSLIGIQDEIQFEFTRLGSNASDTRNGNLVVTGFELVYSKKIDKENADL